MTEREVMAESMLALRRAANALPDEDRLKKPLLRMASTLELRTARRGFKLVAEEAG